MQSIVAPAALVDFLQHFEQGFGVSIKDLMTREHTQEGD